jgi:hypothetical protein
VALDVFVAEFAVRLNQILGHLFVSVLGNKKEGQPIVDCRSVSKLAKEQRQVLRAAIKFDWQLLRRRLEEIRVRWVVEVQDLSVGERRCKCKSNGMIGHELPNLVQRKRVVLIVTML